MGAGSREAERSSCRFVLTRPAFSGHTRTAAQNRESQDQGLKNDTSRHKRQCFLTWTAAHGRKRQENQTNERATDHPGARRRKTGTKTCIRGGQQTITGRKHVFVALNRQSRDENMFSWRSTDIGDVNV